MRRLTDGQKMVLIALANIEGWMPLDWLRNNIRRSAASLKARDFIKIRGGVGVKSIRLPVEVAITSAGRAALAQSEEK